MLKGHTTMVWSIAFSPDGSILASGDNDGVIKIWDIESGKCLTTLRNNSSAIGALIFKSDDTLQSFDSDENNVVWNVKKGAVEYSLKTVPDQRHTNWTKAMGFNQDGTLAALGSDSHRVKLYHIGQKSATHILRNPVLHEGQVWSVAFSFDGQLLASGDDEGNLVLWDVEAETCRQVLRSDRPYEHMNIHGVQGLLEVQRESLRALGAIE